MKDALNDGIRFLDLLPSWQKILKKQTNMVATEKAKGINLYIFPNMKSR
jgi:hypothetical protein